MSAPLLYRWSGTAMEILPRFQKTADATFVVGKVYRLEQTDERSDAEHNHLFAELNEIFDNLPESIADQFASVTHLRKALLIDAGYYHETVFDAGSHAAAVRLAALMVNDDMYCRVVVRGPIVVRRQAKSMRKRSSEMSVAEFRAAKARILDMARELIGVKSPELERKTEGAI